MSTTYISILESSKAELQGPERTLSLAKQAVEDFKVEHADKAVSPELAWSLAYERDAVLTEVDEAERRVRHCEEVIADPQLAAAVEDDSVSDLILGLPQEVDEAETMADNLPAWRSAPSTTCF